ncbi:MAG: TonB-dependent receptor, partial [Gammaproteobacteria bacterium]
FLNESGDDSGTSDFNKISPRMGLLWDPARWINLYFNFSTAFETPTTTELANPDGGGFNPELTTQTAISYEIGMKGAVPGRLPVDYDISLYQMEVDNELVPFETDGLTGRTFFQNAGETGRKGIEIGLSAELLPELRASVAWSYINARFDRFRTADEVLDGNRIPGIPNQHLHAELRFDDPRGWYTVWDMLYVDSFYADNSNLVKTDSYAVSNLKLGYQKELDSWMISPFVSVNNIFNEEYNSNVRINAGFGRHYEPAPLRSYYGGVTARLTF